MTVKTKRLKAKAALEKQQLQTDIVAVTESLDQELGDATWLQTYKGMFQQLQVIMQLLETRVLESEKSADVYALMALYNQMREVIADIRAMLDLTQNTQRIIDQIMYPLVRDISNNYVDAIFLIQKNLRLNVEGEKYVELKEVLNGCLREHAKYIQSAYEKSTDKLGKLLES